MISATEVSNYMDNTNCQSLSEPKHKESIMRIVVLCPPSDKKGCPFPDTPL